MERFTNRKRELLRQLRQVAMLRDIFKSLQATLPDTLPGKSISDDAFLLCSAVESDLRGAINEENEKLRRGELS